MREKHQSRKAQPLLSLAEARRKKPVYRLVRLHPSAPVVPGHARLQSCASRGHRPVHRLDAVFPCLGVARNLSANFEAEGVGPKARETLRRRAKLLERIVREKLLEARAVIGFFPANSVLEDIEVYTDESRGLLMTFHTLRQQQVKSNQEPNYAVADFVAPRECGKLDYLGAFAATAGLHIEPLVEHFEKDHDDYNALMAKALADRLAEGLAELMHKRARIEWGFGQDENLEPCRSAPRAVSRHSPGTGLSRIARSHGKAPPIHLLCAEVNAGMTLTENFAMYPAASVSGFYFSHPESKYFAVGKIDRGQIEDYSRRKGMDLRLVERWLSPNLNYDPDAS